MIKIYELPPEEREKIKSMIRRALSKKEGVLFAYVHGSFIEGGPSGDIDIAVYEDGACERFYEMEPGDGLTRLTGFPIEVKLLNEAPVTFRFSVINGELLFSKDEKARCRFEEETMARYHDYLYYLELYRREVLGI